MSRKEIYKVVPMGDTGCMWEVIKADFDFNYTGKYHVSKSTLGHMECDCFAGNKSTCRHRMMVDLFVAVDYHHGQWYNFDKAIWIPNPQGDTDVPG